MRKFTIIIETGKREIADRLMRDEIADVVQDINGNRVGRITAISCPPAQPA